MLTTKAWPVWAFPKTATRSSVPPSTTPSGGIRCCHGFCVVSTLQTAAIPLAQHNVENLCVCVFIFYYIINITYM